MGSQRSQEQGEPGRATMQSPRAPGHSGARSGPALKEGWPLRPWLQPLLRVPAPVGPGRSSVPLSKVTGVAPQGTPRDTVRHQV